MLTSLARTYVDVLARPDLAGGWEEVCRSLDNIAALNIEKVIEYCLALKNNIVAAKVGYFLEQRQGAFSVSQAQLSHLQTNKPISPQYIHHHAKESCVLIKKWNLMVPKSIVNRIWEEPNNDNI